MAEFQPTLANVLSFQFQHALGPCCGAARNNKKNGRVHARLASAQSPASWQREAGRLGSTRKPKRPARPGLPTSTQRALRRTLSSIRIGWDVQECTACFRRMCKSKATRRSAARMLNVRAPIENDALRPSGTNQYASPRLGGLAGRHHAPLDLVAGVRRQLCHASSAGIEVNQVPCCKAIGPSGVAQIGRSRPIIPQCRRRWAAFDQIFDA